MAKWGRDIYSLARVTARSGPFFPGARDPLAPLPAQRQSGALVPAAGVRHISHRRFLATFPLAAVRRAEQDLYRCVSQAQRGVGVSNFAELIVKGELGDACGGRASEGRGERRVGAQVLPGGGVLSGGAAHGRVGKEGFDQGRGLTAGRGLRRGTISPAIRSDWR